MAFACDFCCLQLGLLSLFLFLLFFLRIVLQRAPTIRLLFQAPLDVSSWKRSVVRTKVFSSDACYELQISAAALYAKNPAPASV